MSVRRLSWLGVFSLVIILVGVLAAIPVWGAPFQQADDPVPDTFTGMHEACETGNVQAMTDAMSSLSDEDWQVMGGHMGGGHHGTMGFGMMGGWSGQRMTGGEHTPLDVTQAP